MPVGPTNSTRVKQYISLSTPIQFDPSACPMKEPGDHVRHAQAIKNLVHLLYRAQRRV